MGGLEELRVRDAFLQLKRELGRKDERAAEMRAGGGEG